jgi:hypothetical protein
MAVSVSKPKPPRGVFTPDCEVECLGKREPARYLKRCSDNMRFAWVQLPDGVYCINVIDIYVKGTTNGL